MLSSAPQMAGFTDSGWFIVAAAIVLVTVGAIISMVSFQWGRNDAMKPLSAVDRIDNAGEHVRSVYNFATHDSVRNWIPTSDGFYVESGRKAQSVEVPADVYADIKVCQKCGRGNHEGLCARARASSGTSYCLYDPCFHIDCEKHHPENPQKSQ